LVLPTFKLSNPIPAAFQRNEHGSPIFDYPGVGGAHVRNLDLEIDALNPRCADFFTRDCRVMSIEPKA
jgi:hypothetical protein